MRRVGPGSPRVDPRTVARAQGLFNVVGGVWPLVSLRTFGRIYGPIADGWLQKTSGALLLSAGWNMLRAASASDGESVRHARRTGVGTALAFLAIDLAYVPRGRIRATYLLDAAMEIAWLAAWSMADRPAAGSGHRAHRRAGRRTA
ncbi:hypothetical protein RND61_09850 [Streptomyces sp. TRM76323]|uniref:Lysoplasmalogenase n=1 Tax=Streptomyces tamarix TaxID=3078565 RepID=A0ABU3QHX5_9ACTN|nr:hypothetical protein [Streptomyces tamarix]MDT9682370.1 hypothetical protein [Streptomyces tamarix]